MRKTLLTAAAVLMTLSGAALAQTVVITQEPVMPGARVVLPGEVRTYVMEQQVPSIAYEGPVVVGEPLPEDVEVYEVQDQPDYGYTIVNERRVIIDPQTRSVIQVLD